jgi:hypothetical protein
MPMMATVLISSMRVKPRCNDFLVIPLSALGIR